MDESGAMMPAEVTIVEVGPRDGLQNETRVLPAAAKVELIQRLIAGGLRRIETASFVHPQRVPQMADAEAVMTRLGPSSPETSFIGLVLNQRGLERALNTTVDEINFSVAATEGFSRSNQAAAVDEVMRSIESMVPLAKESGRSTTVTISVVWGCPFDGEVAVESVATLAERATAAGVDEIALGDTIGVAVPIAVTDRIRAVRSVTDVPLRVHFHDTRNTGIANVVAALLEGVTAIDASVGGAGGCPFAPNATGNVATEDVLYLLERSGISTGVDLEQIAAAGHWLGAQLGRSLPSAIGRAGGFPGT